MEGEVNREEGKAMWTSISIQNKSADIFTPPTPVRQALLFLHPHGDETLSGNPAFTDALAAAGLACCCPLASKTWWSDRIYAPFDAAMSAEAFLLNCLVPWMRETWQLPERAIAVAGISMGGQGALRLGFKYAEQFPIVAGIASAIDYQVRFDEFEELPRMYRSKEACRQDTATLQIKPNAFPRHIWFACDPQDEVWYTGNDRLHEKLRAIGVQHTADLETSNGGHSWQYFNAMAKPMMEFISAALAKESRRLM